ncbi:hypothetical protein [Streptomyces sp. NPDC059134]|uniref:hypothetical protein n=1 Tax=Streptomyces sp. NPDC059134 TaxID=3346738 RepID=UPI00368B8C0B
MNGTGGGATRERRARPGARPGGWAVLLAVLAALVHVLGCAHGPVSAAPSAGVPAGTAVMAYQPSAALPVAGCAGRASHGAASCADADEPSVLPQRTDASAVPPEADRTPAPEPVAADAVAPPAHPARDGAPAGACADPDHRRRAALGVWRN